MPEGNGCCYTTRVRLIGPARSLVLVAVLCAGCPPPDDEFTGDAGPPELSVGTGETMFEPVMNGDELELVFGPQGGWHVIVSSRMSGVDPDGATLRVEVIDAESDEVLAQISLALLARRLDRSGPSWFKLNDFLIFDIAGPSEVIDRDVIVRAHLTAGDIALTDERAVTIVDREP